MACNYMTPAAWIIYIWPDFGWINPKEIACASEREFKAYID
jgi:hypothetical protein